jgi:hypothetical protein
VTALALSDTSDLPAPRTPLGRAFLVFVWLLPFHILAMAVLFGAFGVPAPVVRALSAWKELLAAALIVGVVVRALAGQGPRLQVRPVDLIVAALGLLALVYLAGAGFWFGTDLPFGARALGLRDAAVFSLLYFVGRSAPELADDPRFLRAIVAVGVVTSVIAILERLLVTPQMLVVLGAAQYVQQFLGLAVTTIHNAYGLPDSYWTFLGGHLVQRAGSTYLSSQGFAVPFLVIVPAATVGLFTARRRRGWALAASAVVWTGLLLTITRMTTFACLVEVLALAALYRRWGSVIALGVLLSAGATAALLLVPGFAGFVWQSLTWESVSSLSHLKDWTQGVTMLFQNPLGLGLGAGGLIAARFGLPTIAADSQYFKYSVELGLPGITLYLAALGGFVLAGVRAFRSGRTEAARACGAVVAAATIGIAINSLTTVLFATPFLTFVFFWLAGTAVSTWDART